MLVLCTLPGCANLKPSAASLPCIFLLLSRQLGVGVTPLSALPTHFVSQNHKLCFVFAELHGKLLEYDTKYGTDSCTDTRNS